MAKISAQELAELAPCSLDYVRRLEGLGILEADGDDGEFPPSDVHVVRLMAAFEEAGIALEDVARGVSGGALSFPLGVFMPDPVGMTETYAGLAARVGRSPDLLRRLSRELGLPPPSDDRVRAEDAEILSLIVTQLDLADDEELSRFARLYGGSVQRLVASGLQFFDLAVRQRVGDLELWTRRGTPSSTRRRPGTPSSSEPSCRGSRRAPGARRARVHRRRHGRLHGGKRNHASATAAASRDRVPRPHRVHGTGRRPRRSGRGRPGGGSRERRTGGGAGTRRETCEVAGRRRHVPLRRPGQSHPQRPRPRRADREGDLGPGPDRDQRRRGDRPRRATTSGGRSTSPPGSPTTRGRTRSW